jgi:hyperosmotically inducible periplasmic protein
MKSFNVYKQIRSANRILLIPCLAAFLGLAGCPDGSSQQAGQRMNSDAEKAQKKIEKSKKAASKELEVLKDTVEQKGEQAKENIDRNTETAKETLEKVEEKVDQAKDKVDQIQENTEKKLDVLKESLEKPETTGEYIDDSVTTIKVKSAILGSSWLSASHIEVTTVKGIVTLSGTVDSEQNIAKAIDVAKSQDHVMGVQTDLIVSDNTSSKK